MLTLVRDISTQNYIMFKYEIEVNCIVEMKTILFHCFSLTVYLDIYLLI